MLTSPPRMSPRSARASSRAAISASRGRGEEGAERALHDRPACLDQPLVRDGHQLPGRGMSAKRAGLARGPRQRDEVGIGHRRGPGPGQGPPRSLGPEIAGLASEADPRPLGVIEHHLEPEAVRARGLRLLHAVAGNVGGVAEAGEQMRRWPRRTPRPRARPARRATSSKRGFGPPAPARSPPPCGAQRLGSALASVPATG